MIRSYFYSRVYTMLVTEAVDGQNMKQRSVIT